jgi:hypothetical protein
MTFAEVAALLETCRSNAEDEARRTKDSTVVAERLRAAYITLDAAGRAVADAVLAAWISADDKSRRFDAAALVDELRIVACAPALAVLRARLASEPGPISRFELRKVDRLLAALTGRPSPG